VLSRGNHHIVIRVTHHYGYLRKVGHEVGEGAESLNKMDGLGIGIVVALAVASLLVEKHPLCFVQYLLREAQEKSSFTGMAKELVRYPALGEEGADEDGRIKDGAGHVFLGDTL
jgi:hypothetical protein